jgi:glycosyltransferase involved in cell wall biosynthesis
MNEPIGNSGKRPRISIVTSVYNNASEISAAVESVFSQRGVDIEYIVVDGGSTDGTLKILEGYGTRIHKLISGPDLGIYDGLNRGIGLATGDYVGFLHSDDLFADEHTLKRLFARFSQLNCSEWPEAVYGDLVYVEKHKPDRIVRYWKSCAFSLRKLRNGWMPPHPSLYVRRDVMLHTGLFDITMRISSDYKFILQLFRQPLRFEYVEGVVVKMRTGGASNRSLKAILQKTHEDIQALRAVKIAPFRALLMKNISKIPQFFRHRA